jgi:predicted permease
MNHLWHDLVHAARALAQRPLLTIAAILSLALGIGANTATFLFIEALLLRPLPAAHPENLVALYTTEKQGGYMFTSYPNFRDYRESLRVFNGLTGSVRTSVVVSGKAEPEQVPAELVTGNYFKVLGLEPAAGRFPVDESDGSPAAYSEAVVSYSFWQRHFDATNQRLGQTILINGHPFTVVGVTPPGFRGLYTLNPRDVWVQLATRKQLLSGNLASMFDLRRGLVMTVVGRLRDGTELGQANAAVRTAAYHLEQAYPSDNHQRSASLVPLQHATINPELRDRYVLAGRFLSGIVALVLVIACLNVANLLLVRGLSRQREIAIQISLGASRRRLIQRVLMESVLLTFLGGVAGLFLAIVMRDILWAFRPPRLPESLNIALDPWAVGFALVLVLGSALLVGVLPALRTTRPDLVGTLKENAANVSGGNGRGLQLRKALVAAQIAFSMVALTGAGLFLHSLQYALNMDLGFDTSHTVVSSFDLGLLGYDDARLRQFYHQAIERISAIPGVASASLSEHLALSGHALMRTVFFPSADDAASKDGTLIESNSVAPNYFETMKMAILHGRSFTAADRDGAQPVAVINQTLADRYWPGRDAVGQTLRIFGVDTPYHVVGVARNANYSNLGDPPAPFLYLPIDQNPSSTMTLVIRVQGDPGAVTAQVRQTLKDLDHRLPVPEVRTMRDIVRQALWAPRACAALMVLFGGLATLLAVVGIYSVMVYSVNQRRRELGIRMSLGATADQIRILVLREAMNLVAIGIAVGVGAGILAGRGVQAILFGLSPTDPSTLTAAAVLLAIVGLAGSFLPAHQASLRDPLEVLRSS